MATRILAGDNVSLVKSGSIPGLREAIKYVCNLKREYTLYDASVVFNLLCPNERPVKAAKPLTIPPLDGFAFSYKTLVYRNDTGTKLDYKKVAKATTKSLIATEEIPDDPEPIAKSFKFITDIIERAVTTAHGSAVKCVMVYTDEQLDELAKLVEETNSLVVVDIETDGLAPHVNDILGIGISLDCHTGWYIPTKEAELGFATIFGEGVDITNEAPSPDKIRKFVKQILSKKALVAHNAKFEYSFFKTNYGAEMNLVHDTMVGEYILDCSLKGRFNLGSSVADRFPRVSLWKEDKSFFTKIKTFPISKVGTYCAKDCCHTYLLFLAQYAQLVRDFQDITYNIDMPFVQVAAEAELHGFAINEAYLRETSDNLLAQADALEDEIIAEVGNVNIDSTPQLREILFDTLQMTPVKLTKTGAASVDAACLEELYKQTENPVLKKILDRRTLKKIAGTYTLSLIEKKSPVTGHIHPSFQMINTETGRLACVNPNFQNLPKNASDLIRVAIVAPTGKVMIFADYAGQEVRVLAAASGDVNLIRCYNPCYKCPHAQNKNLCPKLDKALECPDHCKPIDVHSLFASKVYKDVIGDTPIWEIKKKFEKERSISKATTFLLCYGGAAGTLAARTGIPIDEAKRIFEEYFKLFPGVKEWIQKKYEFALTHGYSEDLLGRRRYYPILNNNPDPKNSNSLSPFKATPRVTKDLKVEGIKYGGDYWKMVMGCMRQCQNQPIQGTSAEMTKEGALFARKRFKEFKFSASVIGFVHDEIISVCPRNTEAIKTTVEAIQKAMTTDIDLVGKYGFPEALDMEIEISIGDNWGRAMPVDKYLEMLAKEDEIVDEIIEENQG